MSRLRLIRVLLVGMALLTGACSSSSAASQPDVATTAAGEAPSAEAPAADGERDTLVIPLTLYRLIDADAGADGTGLGTARTTVGVETIGDRMNTIWEQADIVFDPLLVRDIEVPADLLAPIVAQGNIDPLTDALRTSIEVPDPGVINGFYLSEAFGVNGFAPTGTRIFFVVDEPTVPDERVSSHEVGHLFGLHHVPNNPTQLMFSGTDGQGLSDEEQAVARYVVKGILDGQR